MGVDSSTQSVKVVVRDAQTGELLASSSRKHPDGTEVDPNEWWVALQGAIEEVGGLADIAAISIAGQQHGMIVLDERGEVIRPALLWNDTRSAEAADALNAEFANIHELVGSKLVASFTITKLRWLRENEPENASKVSAIALPHDWLSWKLSGSTELADLFTDRSDASGSGYFDATTNEYRRELVAAALGHADVILPRVLAPHHFGFDNGALRIAAGAGDNAAGALGVGGRSGDLFISLGTSGTAFAVSKVATQDSSGVVAGFADATGNFLPLACTLNAAKIFDSTAALFSLTHDEFAAAALAALPGAGGIRFLPHLDGERTPNLPDAQGAIFGLTHENFTVENICRASIEGVLAGLALAVEELEALGVTIERVLLMGGASRSAAVQEIAAEIFEHEVEVMPSAEYVADGAARQAAWALSGKDAPPDWPIAGRRVVPRPSARSQTRAEYLELLRSL